MPAGTVTLIRVNGLNGMFGVNTAASPDRCQLPPTLGVTLGIGDPAASGAENVTRIGSLPSACLLPGAGVTDITRNGPPRVTAPLLTGALGGVLPRDVST
jgi:hypothetical protein